MFSSVADLQPARLYNNLVALMILIRSHEHALNHKHVAFIKLELAINEKVVQLREFG